MDSLPNELLVEIFNRLPRHHLLQDLGTVSWRWNDVSKTPRLWQNLDIGHHFEYFNVRQSFMEDFGFSAIRQFHLTLGDRFSEKMIARLESVLSICRNIHEVDLDIRLAGTPPAIREKLFSSLLQEDKLSNIKSLTFNVKGDWDNHEIFQILSRFSASLRQLHLRCHIPFAIEIMPRMSFLRDLDLDLKGIQETGIPRVVRALRQTSSFIASLILRSLDSFANRHFCDLFQNDEGATSVFQNLTSLSLRSFCIDFRLLGRVIFRSLPFVTSLALHEVDLTDITEAHVNPFTFLTRSLRSFELTLNLKRLHRFSGNVNDFAGLYLLVYQPLADFFFKGVSLLPNLTHLLASLILYEPCIFEWQMVHCMISNAEQIVVIEDRELMFSDFLMLFRRLDAQIWIFEAYRSLTVRIADSLTNETFEKLSKILAKATSVRKLTVTLSGKVTGRDKTGVAFINKNLETLIVYSSHLHENKLNLFEPNQHQGKDLKSLKEIKLYGLHAFDSCLLEHLSSISPFLTTIDISSPDGIQHEQLLHLKTMRNLKDLHVTVSLQHFHKSLKEAELGSKGLSSQNLKLPKPGPDREILLDGFVCFFRTNFPMQNLDELFPKLHSFKIILQASTGVTSVLIIRNCLDQLSLHRSWRKK